MLLAAQGKQSPLGGWGAHSWFASALMGRSSPARCRLPAQVWRRVTQPGIFLPRDKCWQ